MSCWFGVSRPILCASKLAEELIDSETASYLGTTMEYCEKVSPNFINASHVSRDLGLC